MRKVKCVGAPRPAYYPTDAAGKLKSPQQSGLANPVDIQRLQGSKTNCQSSEFPLSARMSSVISSFCDLTLGFILPNDRRRRRWEFPIAPDEATEARTGVRGMQQIQIEMYSEATVRELPETRSSLYPETVQTDCLQPMPTQKDQMRQATAVRKLPKPRISMPQ
jgi:hypothetical protein